MKSKRRGTKEMAQAVSAESSSQSIGTRTGDLGEAGADYCEVRGLRGRRTHGRGCPLPPMSGHRSPPLHGEHAVLHEVLSWRGDVAIVGAVPSSGGGPARGSGGPAWKSPAAVHVLRDHGQRAGGQAGQG